MVVGQVVCVPYNVVTTTQPSNYYCASGTYPYTVKSGDTCNTIGFYSLFNLFTLLNNLNSY